MEDPNALLDKFTQLLAYVGDEGAKDGYFLRMNNSGKSVYSINIRPEPVTDEDITELVRKIKGLLTKNKPVKEFPQDVVAKANELQALYNSSNEGAKQELIEYIDGFGNTGMHGGRRKTNRRSKNRKNRTKRSRK
jgi:hypothetical protein